MSLQTPVGPGVHVLKPDAYHGDPCERPSLSSTIARKLLMQSPRHAWHASPRLNPDHEAENKPHFDIGRVAHRLILGRGDEYTAIPHDVLSSNGAASTKEAKAFIAQAREAGVTPIKVEELEAAEIMAASVQARLREARMQIDPQRSELVAVAEIDGVLCRMMADNAPSNRKYLIDVKTTVNASPTACIRHIADYGYDMQAAHYLDTWEAATGERRAMRFVFVEKAAPHEVSIVELLDDKGDEADWMADARQKAASARRVWGECLAADTWPGYPARIARVGAPVWHRRKWEEHPGTPTIEPKPSRQALDAAHKAQAPGGAA